VVFPTSHDQSSFENGEIISQYVESEVSRFGLFIGSNKLTLHSYTHRGVNTVNHRSTEKEKDVASACPYLTAGTIQWEPAETKEDSTTWNTR